MCSNNASGYARYEQSDEGKVALGNSEPRRTRTSNRLIKRLLRLAKPRFERSQIASLTISFMPVF